MIPAYAAAAVHFKNDVNTPNIRLAKMDATLNKPLASKYGVSGFPTIILF